MAVSFIALNAKIQDTLTEVLTPEQLSDFYKTPAVIASFNLMQQIKVRETYIDAFAIDMHICLGIAAASLLCSFFSYQKNPPTTKKRLDELEEVYRRSEMVPGSGNV